MKSVFLTGGTGFLGKALIPRLLEEGFHVTALTRKPLVFDEHLYPASFKYVNWVTGDVLTSSDDFFLTHLKNKTHVFHLAGLIGYRPELRQQMFDINVKGTERLLGLSISSDINYFVYLSSVTAIGSSFSPNQILNEQSPYNLEPYHFGYFDSKHLAEKRLIEISTPHPIKTLIVNPSTIYGAGDSEKGSRKVQVKVAQGKFLFSPSGGVNVVYLQDVIDTLIAILQRGQKNRRYILGSENLLLSDVFSKIALAAGQKPPPFVLPKWLLLSLGLAGESFNKMGDQLGLSKLGLTHSFSYENAKIATMYHWFDNSRAQKELGINFKPASVAIEESVTWLLKNSVKKSTKN